MPARIRTGFAGLVSALLLFQASGEDPPAPEPTIPRMLPKGLMVMEPSFEGPDELRWRHGEKLAGKLSSFTEGRWWWTSSLFSGPLPLRQEMIRRIDFSSPVLRRESPFRVILTDGSHLCGLPEKAEGDRLFLRSTHCGLVELKLDWIAAMERIGGADVILGGPQALVVGTEKDKDKDKRATRPAADEDQNGNALVRVPWSFAAGGAVATAAFGQELKLAMDQLPEKCVLDLAWRCEQAPSFAFRMADDGVARAVETWGDELVLTDGIHFASAGKVFKDDDRAVHLRLAWDRKAGISQLFDAEGRMLVELKGLPPAKPKAAAKKAPKVKGVGLLGALKALAGLGEVGPSEPEEPVEAPPENGFQFQNKGPALKIERFSLIAWSGQALPALLKDRAGAETAEAALPGEFAGLKDGTLTLRQPDGMMKELPLESLRAMRWNRQIKEARDPGLTQLWFSDGDLLCGRLEKVEEGKAVFDCAVAAAPVVASLKWERALVLAEPGEKPALPDLKKMDRMVAGKSSLHGTIVPDAAGPLPGFQLAGSFEPVIPAYARDLVLTWTRTPEALAKRAEALLHVKGNETFPVTLHGVSRNKVDFTWDITNRRELADDQVQAVQFANPPVLDAGFDGPGWRTLDSQSKKPVRKGGSVILSPGSGIGHAFMMQGAELGFTLSRVNGLAMMRVKLFTQGTDRTSGGVNFLLADFGSEVYGGQERGEGQFSQNSVASREENEVVIKLGGQSVEMMVNGTVLATVRQGDQKSKNSGMGIILETASVWGNQPGEVKLAGFHSEVSPFLAAAPQFSEDARREALLLPRMRRDDPPRQVLIGRNGDLLRGEIEATTPSHLAFRSGLESLKVPIDRVAAAVWLLKPDPAPKSDKSEPEAPKTAKTKEPEAAKAGKPLFDELIEQNTPAVKKAPAKPAPEPQWLDLTNGGRIALQVQSWTESTVSGTHPLLGECRIPTSLLGNLAMQAPAPGQASATLSDWKLVRTPDPILPEAGGDSSALNGKPAPGFKLALLEGGDFSLESQKGKVVVLDFWATWCGPCVQSLPGLVEAMAGFPPEQVCFLAVNQAEAKPLVKRFVEARQLKMAVGLDTDQAVAKKYGVEGIPHTVVIGPDGTVVFVKTGASSGGEKEIAAAVQKALPPAKIE